MFEALVRFPDLLSNAQKYTFRIGFGDSNSGDMTDGVYFEYSENNDNWQCKTTSNSTRTTEDSGEEVLENTWTRVRIEVNAAGSEAKFYVGGSLKSTISTNIPTGAGRELGCVASIVKTKGKTERTAQVDYKYVKIEFTTAR